MKTTISRSVRMPDAFSLFLDTVNCYQEIIYMLIPIVDAYYDKLCGLKDNEAQMRIVSLIHTTKGRKKNGVMQPGNDAIYRDIELMYPGTPRPIYQNAAEIAYSTVRTYRANHELWEKEDWNKRGREPYLQRWHNSYPTFYSREMYIPEIRNGIDGAKLKLYNSAKGSWDWHWFPFSQSDIRNLSKTFDYRDASCPRLDQHGDRFNLEFTYDVKGELKKRGNLICAVDIGINHLAVCVIMRRDSVVLAKKFISLPLIENRLRSCISKKNKARSRGDDPVSLEHYIEHYNDFLTIYSATEIVNFADKWDVDTIVMENFSKKSRIGHGGLSERIHIWRPKELAERVETLAHRKHMHISTVNARNTSKLAYDGSGEIDRSMKNASNCTFPNDRQFNTDLSAAYNIGARFFIREVLEEEGQDARRKMLTNAIPALANRSRTTWADYIRMLRLLGMKTEAIIPEGKIGKKKGA